LTSEPAAWDLLKQTRAFPKEKRLSGAPQISRGAMAILPHQTRPVCIPAQAVMGHTITDPTGAACGGSRATTDRPGLDAALEDARDGDVIGPHKLTGAGR
jgi:hypothetical protein